MSEQPRSAESADFLKHGGQTGELIRAHDWAATPLGPIASWPQSLRTAVSLIVHSPVAIVMLWGEDGIMIYNDAYSVFAGGRHPEQLGMKVREGWPEVADFNDNVMKVGLAGGTLAYRDQELTLHRHGRPEQVWMNLDYSPVYDESGQPAGVIAIVIETTERVLAERRSAAERERQGLMLQQMPGFAGLLSGPDHRYTYVNDAYVAISGPRNFLGRTVREVFPELAGQGFYELLDRVYATGESFAARAMPIQLSHDHGGQRFIDFLYQPVRDDAGQVTGIFVGGYDVTERVRAEAERQASDQRLRAALDAGDTGTFRWDIRTNALEWDEALDRLFGLEPCKTARNLDQFIAMVHPEDRAGVIERCEACARDGADFDMEFRVVWPDGSTHWLVDRGKTFIGDDGAAAYMAGACVDITARKRAESLRIAQNRLLEAAVGDAPLGDLLDSLLRTIEVESASGMIGSILLLSPDERHLQHGAAPSLPPDYNEAIDGIAIGPDVGSCGTAAYLNRPVYVADIASDPLWANFRDLALAHQLRACWSTPILSAGGVLLGTFAMYYREPRQPNPADLELIEFVTRSASLVIERKRAEEALRLQAEEFQTLADNMATLCWMAEPDGHIFWYNRRWYEYTGTTPDSQEGWGWESVHDPEMLPRVAERWRHSIATGERFEMTFPLKGADGVFRPFLTRIVPIRGEDGRIVRWFGTNVDVTEQMEAEALLERRVAERTAELLKAEEALRQSQKMEAMGQLTGGVAHDFNNLLTPIVGSLDLLHRRGIGDEREQRLIDGALQSAERAKTLVQRLLAFARRQPLQPRALDVAQLVRGMAALVASTSGPQIKVVVDVPDGLPTALADPNQLEMAILNLSVNARDAMPDGGTLRISAAADAVARDRPGLRAGDYVRLSVADTGSGMSEETLARAAEPFFSTKGIGKGTGLGLSMVHGLASQLGGALTLSSRPGLGTNVELWLPVAGRPADLVAPSAAAGPDAVGAGTALLVDDEELVRTSTADMLAELGYDVREAGSAEEALGLLDGGLSPGLVVTDHLMPGMSGTDLARAVRARLPRTRVLVTSGYAETEEIARDLPRLAKPFRRAELAEAIAEL